MKKFWLFLFSSFIAFGIAYYSKTTPHSLANKAERDQSWKTFVKKSSKQITGHQTTVTELLAARIPTPVRSIATEKKTIQGTGNSTTASKLPTDRAYVIREDRILIGDLEKRDYQDEQVELEMINSINPEWKDILGNDLLRYQFEDTKVMIKEEYPVIKIQNGKGQYLEQVIVTYLFKNGGYSSYRALIDSESGFVTETWDKTVNEKVKIQGASISLPESNVSGITAH
jgi:hypothetical protein